VEVDCNACRGAGNVDIPKWRKKALDILNNGSAVAALKHTKTFVNATVSYVETNETLAKLKQKWKGMKKLKRRYNDLVRKGRMKEAWTVKKKLLGSGVKEIGAAFIYVNVMEYGIQFNTISDFINNASLDKDPMAQGWDLGKGLCRDVLSFYGVPTEKEKWVNLGKSIYKIGQCSREPTDDQPACPAAVCGESAKTKDVATGESKCSVCGAHWGTGWDIVYSGGDILLAAAALKFQVNAETIKKCILSLNELRKCKDMKSLMAVLEKDKESYKEFGKMAGKKIAKSLVIQFLGANVISGWLKDYFNQDVKEVIKNFRARWKFKICDMPKLPAALPGQKLLDYAMPAVLEFDVVEKMKAFFMVQCRQRLGSYYAADLDELIGSVGKDEKDTTYGWARNKASGWMGGAGTEGRRRLNEFSSNCLPQRCCVGGEEHSGCLTEARCVYPPFAALKLAIEDQGFEFTSY